MNTPRALLIPAVLALLTACGGGGSDDPEPVLLWEAQASTSGAPDPTETTGRLQWSPGLPAGELRLDRAAFGEACIEGSWTQTGTADAALRLDVRPAGVAIPPGGELRVSAPITTGATITIPFRVCSPFETSAGSRRNVSVGFTILSTGGHIRPLGAYSVTARWRVIGTYR